LLKKNKRPVILEKPKLVHTLIRPGRIMFALGIIALAVLQFKARDYIVGRPPALLWPHWAAVMPGKFVWACISGSLMIIAGLAVILNKKGKSAAIFIGSMILVYSFFLRHLPAMTDWVNAYKSLALAGGAFIVAASFSKKGNPAGSNSYTNELIWTGCIFFSLFFIICGIAHFKFDDFIINGFIPAYIPVHAFWTYFTAVALIAAGTGIIFPKTRKWSAALAGLMILLWFILLHIPRAVNDPKNYGEWMGVFESFTFAGILFVLAGLSAREKLSSGPGGNT
jgi:uncharacterized membrane protein YphA (DoxX/SURF4 family)